MIFISFIMAIAPAIFLVWYYYRQDKEKPEPKGLITKIFFIGFASIIPAIIIELIFDAVAKSTASLPILYYFIKAFIVAGFIEESLKLFIVKKFVYNDIHFDEVMDGIVYAIMASMGFACFENVLYVLDGGWSVALLRAFTAVPLHAVTAGIMGYYIGKAKFTENAEDENSLIIKGLLVAVFIHGLYDFILFSMPEFGKESGLIVIPLIIVCFFVLRRKIKLAIEDDEREGRTTEEFTMNRIMSLTSSELDFNRMSRSELRKHLELEGIQRKHGIIQSSVQPEQNYNDSNKEQTDSNSDNIIENGQKGTISD